MKASKTHGGKRQTGWQTVVTYGGGYRSATPHPIDVNVAELLDEAKRMLTHGMASVSIERTYEEDPDIVTIELEGDHPEKLARVLASVSEMLRLHYIPYVVGEYPYLREGDIEFCADLASTIRNAK